MSTSQSPRHHEGAATAVQPKRRSLLTIAVRDLVDGARLIRSWTILGWHDIRLRYRRSTFGPFWLTISMGILVGVLGTVYGALLRVDNPRYLPHLALGLIFWGLISSLVTDGCTTFVRAQGIIREVHLPLSIHAYRIAWEEPNHPRAQCTYLRRCRSCVFPIAVLGLAADVARTCSPLRNRRVGVPFAWSRISTLS